MKHAGGRAVALAVLLGLGLSLSGGPAAAQDADTPLDRSLQKVEALLTALKARGDADPDLVKQLESIAKDLKDAKSNAGNAGGTGGGDGGGAGPGAGGGFGGGGAWGGDFYGRLVQRLWEGVTLNEKDRKTAEDLLRTFAEDYNVARVHRDEKSRNVIREDVEDRLDRALPKKEAAKLKTNLAGALRWADPRWGR